MQGQTPGYVLTTLLTAPASAALATLANVKDDLDIETPDTSRDATLTRYIGEESAEISRYCNRVFGLSTWQDVFRPQRGVLGEGVRNANNPLKLTRWPLVAAVVEFTGNTYSNQTIDTISSMTGLVQGALLSGPGIAAGTTITGIGSGSITLSQPATATTSGVALSTGLAISETIAGVTTGLTAGTDFEVQAGSLLPGDEGPGLLYRLNQQGNPRTWAAAMITVVYQAGYALANDASPNMPSDLGKACERLVITRYRAKSRDETMVEHSEPELGSSRYWIGAIPGQKGPYPNDVLEILNRYRTPVIA